MGAAGDMLTAALLDLHPDSRDFLRRLNDIGLPGVAVTAEKMMKCGIAGTHVSVTVHGQREESEDVLGFEEHHEHIHGHYHAHDDDHRHGHTPHDGSGHVHNPMHRTLLLSMTVTVMLTHMQILTMHTIMHITIPPAVIITPVFLRSSISSLISKFLKRYREMYWRCTV